MPSKTIKSERKNDNKRSQKTRQALHQKRKIIQNTKARDSATILLGDQNDIYKRMSSKTIQVKSKTQSKVSDALQDNTSQIKDQNQKSAGQNFIFTSSMTHLKEFSEKEGLNLFKLLDF